MNIIKSSSEPDDKPFISVLSNVKLPDVEVALKFIVPALKAPEGSAPVATCLLVL